MTTTTVTRYQLDIRIVDHVDNQGEPCEHCQEIGQEIQTQAYIMFGESGEQVYTTLESCLACLIPALDSTPWLDTDRPIVVEVARSATRRPF